MVFLAKILAFVSIATATSVASGFVIVSNPITIGTSCQQQRTSLIVASSTKETQQESQQKEEKEQGHKAPRHDVPSAKINLTPEEEEKMNAYGLHQQNAPKLGFPADVRTLIQYNHGYAVMSTFSKSDPLYPGGSVVAFTVDEIGQPILCFSGMSSHTQDILVNPHCSLTIASKDFKGSADGRVNLMGEATLITDTKEKDDAKELYLKKHPGAFWVNFGDFNWFRMTVDRIRFVGGFARAGTVDAKDYAGAQPDPIAAFSSDIATHMNDDHMAGTIQMIYGNIPGMEKDPSNLITEAIITSVDSLGMYIKVTREKPVSYLPQQFKLRLPFPRQITERKDVKTMIVELVKSGAEPKPK